MPEEESPYEKDQILLKDQGCQKSASISKSEVDQTQATFRGGNEDEMQRKALNYVNMPPPELVVGDQATTQRGKDRYMRVEYDPEENVFIHLPKERMNMAKIYRNQIFKAIKRERNNIKKQNSDLKMLKLNEKIGLAQTCGQSPLVVTPKK